MSPSIRNVEPILESCCGLDVHRDQVTACIATGPLDKAKEKFIVKDFSAMTYGLRGLASWLKDHNVKTVAMESTGVYWKPIFNILEGDFEVILANAARIKNVPGLKTDKKDARWIAKLLRYGLVPASFIPPKDIRELRDLTRTRKKLTEDRTRHKNRIHKTLQDANIKLSTVATDIFGVSGHAMIMALLEKDDLSLEEIKSMTKGKLMKKIGLLIKALDGKVTDHHRFLLKLHFEHIDSISSQIALLDEEIYQKLEIHNKEFELIRTVPGINAITGTSIIAEIGVDMSRFPSEHHLASWAAMCPGIMRVQGKGRVVGLVVATTTSKPRWWKQPGQLQGQKVPFSVQSTILPLNDVEVREQQSRLVIRFSKRSTISYPEANPTRRSELNLLETESRRQEIGQ